MLIKRPDGGLQRDSIAQTDQMFVTLKSDLSSERYRGTVLADTLRQLRAKVHSPAAC